MGGREGRRPAAPHQLGRYGRRFLDLSGDATGWGINLSPNVKPTKDDMVRLYFVFGEGIQNYMNDLPADIGIEQTSPIT